ncbi:hypothetical protein [Spiroplasma endosymbiont of Stenodema calcarata]|uniref:hypothetical protein n=1 Tax=Spiroplasma endosymbiont of Stenodema calcarata TaxID=3139328 RepID=UPI0030E0DEB3
MFKWLKKKKNKEIMVNLSTIKSFDDDIEAVSGINFNDDVVNEVLTPVAEDNLKTKIISNGDEKGANNIHNLVQNARTQINKYKEEHNVNEHENLLERLEHLKNLRDSSESKPNEFQQMLNQIKERNFNDRMAYIMDRIKVSHRNDNKVELEQNGKSKPKQPKKDNIIMTGNKKEITKIKQKLSQELPTASNPNKDFTITLSVKQFERIVRDTVEDVLVELGIKNKTK